MTDSSKGWHAIDAIAVSDACEAIEYGLMEAGALGTETNEAGSANVIVTGYFDLHPEIEIVRRDLLDALGLQG